MSINATYYGTINEANDYFGSRLHSSAWTNAVQADQPKALLAATRIIDKLNYKGHKATVWAVLKTYLADDNFLWGWPFISTDSWPYRPSRAELEAAELAQPLQFPRDSDTVVPEAIRQACYEIAYSLLDGRDPELDLEALAINHQAYGNVQTTYSRDQVPLEHILNGIPSIVAWRLVRPFLRPTNELKLSRIS